MLISWLLYLQTDLSRQTSPLMRDSSVEETGTHVGVSEFTTASSGERRTTGTSQEGVGSTYTVPTTSQEREEVEERESLEEKNMEYLEGERGMSLAADRKELEGSDQGSCAGVDVDLMDEDPLDASSSVLEGGEVLSPNIVLEERVQAFIEALSMLTQPPPNKNLC